MTGSTARLLPKSLEEQGRADVTGGDDGQAALGMSGEQEEGLGEAGPGKEQSIQLAVLDELIQATQRGDDLLARLAVFPAVFHDLQVGAGARLLGAEEHGALGLRHHENSSVIGNCKAIFARRGTRQIASSGTCPTK